MSDMIALQQKIAPELIETLERRYTILRYVSHSGPVGRRMLAAGLGMGERVIRSELDFLKNQGLLEGESAGVKLTAEGESLVHQLSDYIKDLRGLHDMEIRLLRHLPLGQVILVPGDSDVDDLVKKELGRAAARYMQSILRRGSIVAVTGGTTIGEVASAVPVSHSPNEVLVVPARGGLGRGVEIQANTIAARIAEKLHATYQLLHVPDNIGEDAFNTLMKDVHIRDIVKTIKRADILIHGIGNAKELSVSRGDSPEKTENLIQAGAVGEAFGHYFSQEGRIVHSVSSLGVRLADLASIEHVVGVAGGRRKAEAILSVASNGHETVLITDEGAGRAMLDRLNDRSG